MSVGSGSGRLSEIDVGTGGKLIGSDVGSGRSGTEMSGKFPSFTGRPEASGTPREMVVAIEMDVGSGSEIDGSERTSG